MTNDLSTRVRWPVLLAVLLSCDRSDPARVQTEGSRPPPAVPALPGAEYTPSQAAVVEEDDPATIMVTGFDTPDSVLHDAKSDVYLVSNVAGTPMEKSDNGFISRVSPEGKVLARKWIDGMKDDVTLNAPMGMALAGDVLYVADIDRVRTFDRMTAKATGEIAIDGAIRLADVAVDAEGGVYVADMGDSPTTGAIHRISNGEITVLARGEALGGPSALAVTPTGLWVVTHLGNRLMRIGPDGTTAETTELPAGALAGVAITGDGRFFVSSGEGRAIYAGTPGSTFVPVVEGVEAPADLGYDERRARLLVPRFDADVVDLRPVPGAVDKHATR